MKVETLIFAYLAICGAMIIFNIVCIFVFRRRDKNLELRSDKFTKAVEAQIKELAEGNLVEKDHRDMLAKKLRKVNHLMAFDETLDGMYRDKPEAVKLYIESISPVFVYLTLEYHKKNTLKATYFPYIIKKYKVFHNYDITIVSDVMLELVKDSSLYCRENALQALYSIGDCDSIIKALDIIDKGEHFHNSKLLADGLLTFDGNKERLTERLWQFFDGCSVEMKVTILNYFRFSSGEHCEKVLHVMTESNQNDEVCYSCVRYFGRYYYAPAYPYLLIYTEYDKEERWEYAAIAAFALANYPGEKTVDVLKQQIRSSNWHVRYNASQSLRALGLDYEELIDVFEGTDRYAGEILRYRLDQRRMEQAAKENQDKEVSVCN